MTRTFAMFVALVSLLACGLPASAQYSLDERLCTAIIVGNLPEARSLLEKGADSNAFCWPNPALIAAVRHSNLEMARTLLDAGAQVDVKDNQGGTPLMWAATIGDVEKTRLLLDKGANIEAQDNVGDGSLASAVLSKKMGTVKLLLDSGANIDSKNLKGETPLTFANKNGPAELVDLLEAVRRDRKMLEQVRGKAPSERFAAYLAFLQRYPQDDLTRENIIQLVQTLPDRPAIPEEARQLVMLAIPKIREAKSPAQLDEPVTLLIKATNLAPWWDDAYYDLACALELRGSYNSAIKQLNFYLKLNPPQAEAVEARTRIGVIRALKDAATQNVQRN